ncbi:hypothetical protein LTR28_011494 [Elasticomyces elasticus]|nr:hypothetical protein LTR28_011494 [Elasticomyces elasticus]
MLCQLWNYEWPSDGESVVKGQYTEAIVRVTQSQTKSSYRLDTYRHDELSEYEPRMALSYKWHRPSSHHLYASYAPQILRTSSSAAYAAITDEPVRPSAHPYRPSVERVPTSDADLLLGLASPFHHDSPHPAGQQSYQRLPLPQSPLPSSTTQVFEAGHDTSSNQFPCFDDTVAPFGNMMIESQDIDMHLLGLDMPWFEYLPTDSLHFFEGNGNEEMGPPPAQLPQQDVSDQGRPP